MHQSFVSLTPMELGTAGLSASSLQLQCYDSKPSGEVSHLPEHCDLSRANFGMAMDGHKKLGIYLGSAKRKVDIPAILWLVKFTCPFVISCRMTKNFEFCHCKLSYSP